MDDDRKPRVSPRLFETSATTIDLHSNHDDAEGCSKSSTTTTATAATTQPPPQQQQQHMLSHNTHPNSRSQSHSHSHRHDSDSENQDVKPSISLSSMPPSTALAAAASSASASSASSATTTTTTTTHTSRKVIGNTTTTSIHDASRLMYRRPLPCEGCREWRRKCDLTKPSCNRCIERGAVCTYNPLRYERKNARRSPSSCTSTFAANEESESPPPLQQQQQQQQQQRNPGLAVATGCLAGRKPDSVMAISNIIEPAEDANHPVIVVPTCQQNESSNHGISGLVTAITVGSAAQRRYDHHTESTAKRKQQHQQQHQQQQQQQALSKRGKACTFCHRRKTKCDMSKPACSDCANRGLECVYLN
ncbi:hypothetical protein CcCBS67573_g03461 [Chytriomyces confervae]|uniref:Zn(2)-C6 fungal-type domain-containing protein n=1 Tax=Chytriomyces confervae TaxID=246404 RepID=A0A507FHZ3_9FUNG|nr:hypothetical protein CcCBS67573_g03461 [Chytriomyces confervae]